MAECTFLPKPYTQAFGQPTCSVLYIEPSILQAESVGKTLTQSNADTIVLATTMAEEARSPLRSPSMRSQLSQIIQALQKQQEKLPVRSSDKKISVREVAVALMGATGAGKSTFIKRVTSADSVVVGSGLQSGMMRQELLREDA